MSEPGSLAAKGAVKTVQRMRTIDDNNLRKNASEKDAEKTLANADAIIDNSCAPHTIKAEWRNNLTKAWNEYISNWHGGRDMSFAALDFDPHAGHATFLIADQATIDIRYSEEKFEYIAKLLI
ncbi:MAG: hypothetical protein FWG06_00190, partial [Clostridiales bacterium]|nr:hypothetical protein [Clostridiales bacterium]